jgi:hypothetical protein
MVAKVTAIGAAKARCAKMTGCSSVFCLHTKFSPSASFFLVFPLFVDLGPALRVEKKNQQKKCPRHFEILRLKADFELSSPHLNPSPLHD